MHDAEHEHPSVDLLWADFSEKREAARHMTAYIRGDMLADVRREEQS